MADTKQITATIHNNIAEWIEQQPERGMASFSKVVELLLKEAKHYRDKGMKVPRDRFVKYIK